MKKLVSVILISAIFTVAIPFASAAEENEDIALQLVAIFDYLERNFATPTVLTNDEIAQITNDGADWIVAAQKDNGSFAYEYQPFADLYSGDNNTVRQGGTFYSLAEVYRYQTDKAQDHTAAIEAAIEYFENISVRGEGEVKDFLCIRNSRSSTKCELGTTALTLLGILSYLATEPENAAEYEQLAEDYLAYIMEARLDGRGFSNKYHIDDGFSDQESSFYNGESMLALVRYYQYKPDENIKTVFNEVFEYLADAETLETPLYLWMMAALKDAQRIWPTEAYVRYAEAFTRLRLDAEKFRRSSGVNYCAPLEGLVSAYSIFENDSTVLITASLEEAIDFWLARVALLQLSENNPYRLVKRDGVLELLRVESTEKAHGGFLTSETELKQRIDFTQHCISAFQQKQVDIDAQPL